MKLPNLAIIAGGLATRLGYLAKDKPKSMVDVAGHPFVYHQLRLAREQGFRNVVMLVGHLGEQIVEYVGGGSAFDLSVDYVFDGDIRRGTGGALRQALSKLDSEFFVLYGDSYLDIDVVPVWEHYQACGMPALMTVLHNRGRWDRSNVVFDGSRVVRHEKTSVAAAEMQWIDYGLSVFSVDCIRSWPGADPFELSSLTQDLALAGRLSGFEVDRRFYEIGTAEGRQEAEDYIRCR